MGIMRAIQTMLIAGLLLSSGCNVVEEIKRGTFTAEAPFGGLERVDLVIAPTTNQLFAWTCFEYGGDATTCGLIGFDAKPKRKDMGFSFDMVFDLFNPNSAFPIPLVDLLLAINVYDGQSLGVICVSFCDPDDAACTAGDSATDACAVDDAEEFKGIGDFTPDVDDLLELGGDIINGDFGDNFVFRVIPAYSEGQCHPKADACEEGELDGEPAMCCGGVCEILEPGCTVGKNDNGKTCALCDGHVEAHVQFDMDIDSMLGILETMFLDAFDSIFAGENFAMAVPYDVEGTLFFDVPKLGRKRVGFGPFEDEWTFVE
jgi:hypothetical protein